MLPDTHRGGSPRPTLTALALPSMLLALAVVACGPPPKQAEVADVDRGAGEDMAGSPDTAGEPAETGGGGVEEMHTKCCVECKSGASKDRSGASMDTVPCADFTDTLSPWCLEHFRSQPTMASKCN